jgi:hypothetical protein
VPSSGLAGSPAAGGKATGLRAGREGREGREGRGARERHREMRRGRDVGAACRGGAAAMYDEGPAADRSP